MRIERLLSSCRAECARMGHEPSEALRIALEDASRAVDEDLRRLRGENAPLSAAASA